jgi:hypothetical protein
MPYERINIQLAIKLNEKGRLPEIFYEKLNEIYTPQQLQTIANMKLIDVIKAMIGRFREYSEKVNVGEENEENTVVAKRHTCDHDTKAPTPCIEEDI